MPCSPRSAPPPVRGWAVPPNRSNWRMDAPAPPTGARWHSPNWRRTACGSRARASDGAPIGASVTAIVAGCGAADTLGLPLGQVRVLHGSTPFLDEGYGAFASRSTVLGGSAVFEAANALLAKIRAAAGARLGCADDPPHTVGQLGGAERPNVLLLPAPVAGGGRGCMLSLFVVWDAAAVAFRVSAGFGAACSRFSLSDGPNRSKLICAVAAPTALAQSPCGTRDHLGNPGEAVGDQKGAAADRDQCYVAGLGLHPVALVVPHVSPLVP